MIDPPKNENGVKTECSVRKCRSPLYRGGLYRMVTRLYEDE